VRVLVKEILRLQEAGATEENLHPVVAEAINESYFTEWAAAPTDFEQISRTYSRQISSSEQAEFRACYKTYCD
jgi:hypothetical protein